MCGPYYDKLYSTGILTCRSSSTVISPFPSKSKAWNTLRRWPSSLPSTSYNTVSHYTTVSQNGSIHYHGITARYHTTIMIPHDGIIARCCSRASDASFYFTTAPKKYHVGAPFHPRVTDSPYHVQPPESAKKNNPKNGRVLFLLPTDALNRRQTQTPGIHLVSTSASSEQELQYLITLSQASGRCIKQLAKMSIDPKFIELTSDVYGRLCQNGIIRRYSSTVSYHGIKKSGIIPRYNNTVLYHTTALPHVTISRYCNTVSYHGITARKHTTVSQYGTPARYHNTVS